MIAGGDGCWISIVDRTGVESARLEAPEVCLKDVSFSPDGRLVAAARWPQQLGAGLDGIDVWDWTTGTLRFATDEPATVGAFDPTGALLATTSDLTGTISLWDVSSGELASTLEAGAPSNDIDFSPDGALLVAGGRDGLVRQWRVDDGTITSILDPRAASIRSTAFSPDGHQLASVDDDGIIRVWALVADDLVRLAESRLTRRLTVEECRQFLHRSACP